jgi:ferrous iron transport protein B
VVSSLAAAILNRIIPRDQKSFFLLELPLYRRPLLRVIFNQAWMKTKSFIGRAGPVIFVLTILLWFGTSFPRNQVSESQSIQFSYLGQMGQKIEPLFEPLGLDWRGGVGLLAAFAAREVFVSTLAVIYNVTAEPDKTGQATGAGGLLEAMRAATNSQGQPVFTTSTVIGLIIFFMIALQCLSTVAMMIRESRSVKIALTQLVIFNGIAYALAVAVVQGLRSLGLS